MGDLVERDVDGEQLDGHVLAGGGPQRLELGERVIEPILRVPSRSQHGAGAVVGGSQFEVATGSAQRHRPPLVVEDVVVGDQGDVGVDQRCAADAAAHQRHDVIGGPKVEQA